MGKASRIVKVLALLALIALYSADKPYNIKAEAANTENSMINGGLNSSFDDDYYTSGKKINLNGSINLHNGNQLITVSLRDSDIKQVLRMFADKAGLNVVFHNSVTGQITLDLVGVTLNNAMEMISQISELSYVVENGTLLVMKSEAAKKLKISKQNINIIPIKYANSAKVANFLNTNIFGLNKPGLSNSETAISNPSENEVLIFGTENDYKMALNVIRVLDKKPKTTTFKVNHTTPAEMADMICSMLLPAASGASSGGSSSGGSSTSSGGSSSGSSSSSDSSSPSSAEGAATGGAAGIMTGAAADSSGGGGSSSGGSSAGGSSSGGSSGGSSSGLTLNAGTVACTLDGQVGGSVTSLGLQNLTVAYYAQLGTVNIIGGSESQLDMIKDFIAETDKKQPQAYLEVSVVELNEDGSKSLSNNWNLWSKAFSATFDGENTRSNPLNPVFFKGNTYDVIDTTGDTPEVKYTISKYNGPLTITYAINYLIKNSKGRVVANPRILITNGEESTIDITQDYVESVDSEQSAYTGGTLATRTYNIGSDAGIKVSITPFISPDGYVTMNIKPEYSTILNQLSATDSIGPYTAATLLSHRNLDLKNVRIKDGETLVIAGMINEEEQKTIGKVPVLGDIPVIGSMFRSTTSEKKKNEMVIMITPKIITDTEDAVGNTDTL